MKDCDKVRWDKDSTVELLSAMKKFEEDNRGPGLPHVSQWTRRLNRWQTIASRMTSPPPDLELDKFARSCSVRFTSVCCMYRRALEGKRRRVLEDEVQKKLQEYFELFPPGRFKHTGRFDETPGSPVKKHGRRQRRKSPTWDGEESRKSHTTSDKTSISGPSDERLRSGNDCGSDEADADEVDGHSSAEEDIILKCQTQESLDTARKLESVLLWLKHWVSRNILPITDALRRPALNPKRRRKVIDRCWKMEVEQLDCYLGGVLAKHPEYLVDIADKDVIEECKPLRRQITVQLNRIGEEMNKIREIYNRSLRLPQDDRQPDNLKSN